MSTYRIITDSCCDLPDALCRELELGIVPLSVCLDGKDIPEGTLPLAEFYSQLRAGKAATTSAVNPQQWKTAIEPALKSGLDALVIAFSSGLSTTYQSAVIAARELQEEYPQRKIRVVDSLAASMGQGLLVWYAAQQRRAGKTLEETAAWVEENKHRVCQWFTVEDLMYLKRGGRISAATALMGTMLQIKPVLHVDSEGKLVNVSKARGRKASLTELAGKLSGGIPGENGTVFLSHGDCAADAQAVAKLVKEKWGVKEVIVNYVGAVIGSHSGPGTVALFYLGENR